MHIDGSEAELEAKIASMLTSFASELTDLKDFNQQVNKTTTQLFDEISSQEREAEELRRNVQELERTICEVQRSIALSKEAQNEVMTNHSIKEIIFFPCALFLSHNRNLRLDDD